MPKIDFFLKNRPFQPLKSKKTPYKRFGAKITILNHSAAVIFFNRRLTQLTSGYLFNRWLTINRRLTLKGKDNRRLQTGYLHFGQEKYQIKEVFSTISFEFYEFYSIYYPSSKFQQISYAFSLGFFNEFLKSIQRIQKKNKEKRNITKKLTKKIVKK